jgi:hypothetical protein
MIYIVVLCQGLLAGFTVAFVLSLIVKWELHHSYNRWVNWYVHKKNPDPYGRPLKNRDYFCFFCVGWWLSFFLCVTLYGLDHAFNLHPFQWQYIFTPFIASIVAVHTKLPG